MQREKMKYQKPVICSVEVGQILPIAASPDVTVPDGGNASGGGGGEGGGGTTPPMQSPRNYWGSSFQTDDDDETAYEYGW